MTTSPDHSSNGASRYSTEKVRVAIVGVGNCASSFVQGVEHYRHADPGEQVPGLMHVDLGGYHVGDIEFSAAFDIDADMVDILRETKTDVVLSYLPVGSEQATKWYVEQVLEAGCAFVNSIPVFIAREDYWARRFKKAGLPIVGDDIKSQVGATIVHRQLARLFGDRGVKMMRTSQLNVGGNMDFYNMLERERLESKKISKTNA